MITTERQLEWISQRAYALWEEQGRPHGRDADHWQQAVEEHAALERTQASADGREVLVKFRSKPTAVARPGNDRPRRSASS